MGGWYSRDQWVGDNRTELTSCAMDNDWIFVFISLIVYIECESPCI